jgi:hypothetical protein
MLELDEKRRDAAEAVAKDLSPQSSSRLAEALLGAALIALLLLELLN